MREGTVIHGTLRPQDLVVVFLQECNQWVHRNNVDVARRYKDLSREVGQHGLLDSALNVIDHHPWWQSEECTEVISDLMDLLSDIAAPHGLYFGAHPGDGSDFGFWRHEE